MFPLITFIIWTVHAQCFYIWVSGDLYRLHVHCNVHLQCKSDLCVSSVSASLPHLWEAVTLTHIYSCCSVPLLGFANVHSSHHVWDGTWLLDSSLKISLSHLHCCNTQNLNKYMKPGHISTLNSIISSTSASMPEIKLKV